MIGFVNLCICNISKTFNVCLVLSHFTVYKQSEADLSHDKNNMNSEKHLTYFCFVGTEFLRDVLFYQPIGQMPVEPE